MTGDQFDAWRETDLLRFLRTFAELSDHRSSASGDDVKNALDLTSDDATTAVRRLRDLDCIEQSSAPTRVGDDTLSFTYVLTATGTRAVMRNELPA